MLNSSIWPIDWTLPLRVRVDPVKWSREHHGKRVGHLLYCHMPHHNDTIINRRRKTSLQIYTFQFIVRVRKGLFKVCVWEGAGDWTELKYFDPHSYGRQSCVFLVLLMLNRRPWGPLCWVLAFFTASYQHLLWTTTHQGPKPLRPGVALPTTSRL